MNAEEREQWARDAARRITIQVLSEAAQGDDPAKAAMAKAELKWRLDESIRKWREALRVVKTVMDDFSATVARAVNPLREFTRALENNDEQ